MSSPYEQHIPLSKLNKKVSSLNNTNQASVSDVDKTCLNLQLQSLNINKMSDKNSFVKVLEYKSKLSQNGQLEFGDGNKHTFTANDLIDEGEIGRGHFACVNRMVHKTTQHNIAVKRIRCTVDNREQKQLLMDLNVVINSTDCPYIVQFYGAIFYEGDCWICMELMDISLLRLSQNVAANSQTHDVIPENIVGKVAVSTVRALQYLKQHLSIIHRDVKPSNILLGVCGSIKLCDFGISGELVDSIARTRDVGCRPYMAPERIDPMSNKCYDIRSDIWSLGITLYEVATGKFPYKVWRSVFEQLDCVVHGDAPRLVNNYSSDLIFTDEFVDFVNTCLQKDVNLRPKYDILSKYDFITRSSLENTDVASYVTRFI